ncbi:MAG: hypothetical protein GY942_05435 [Aestuariibacter sp.]|nr:hypothetical protein [Aestuariibacter sp.]
MKEDKWITHTTGEPYAATWHGETKSLYLWGKDTRTVVARNAIIGRFHNGLSVHEAMTAPRTYRGKAKPAKVKTYKDPLKDKVDEHYKQAVIVTAMKWV